MSTIQTNARLYVGTHAKYNSGNLTGKWLDLSDYSDRDDFLSACRELHADESDPELMFQDYEGFPRAWYCESSAPPEILWEWLELGEDEQQAFAVYAEHYGDGAEIEGFREAWQGQWDSGADFAEHTAEECGELPKDLPTWIVIDWEASWEHNLRHDYFEGTDSRGRNHIFRCM